MNRYTVVGLFLLAFVLSTAISQKTSGRFSKVIYDDDGRTDTYELSTFDQALGHSTVLIVTGFNILTDNQDGTWTATSTATAEKFWDFCPEERYSDQLILSHAMTFCSGFLITNQWVGTAAHCTLDQPMEYLVIFGFELTSKSHTQITFAAEDVFNVHDVVTRGNPDGGEHDYGILQLDRVVTKYEPYTKINNNLSVGDSLTLIGHPMGLPKKTDKGGKVTDTANGVIRGTVDSYGGNSGSPIFDINGALVGILVAGSQDFQYHGSCETSNVCPGHSGCEPLGETMVPICTLITSTTDVEDVIGIDCSKFHSEDVFTYSSALIEELEELLDNTNAASITTLFSPLLLLFVFLTM